MSDEPRQDAPDLVWEFDNRDDRRENTSDRHERYFDELVKGCFLHGRRLRLQACNNPLRQPPIDEKGSDLRHAEVACLALALAHDFQQHRPFADHQYPVAPPSLALGAREIRVHVGGDF